VNESRIFKYGLASFMVALMCCVIGGANANTNQHEHGDHGHGEKPAVKVPRIFLDKSPRIVAYQLKRLTNEQLLLVERMTDHEKYKPVYTAILVREGMSRQDRDEAVAGLVAIGKSDNVTELISAIDELDSSDAAERRVARQLATMVVSQKKPVLQAKLAALNNAIESESQVLRSTGMAGLIVAGELESALAKGAKDNAAKLDLLSAVPLVPQPKSRAALRSTVAGLCAESEAIAVRKSAIGALSRIPANYEENFKLVAGFVDEKQLTNAVISTALRIPSKNRDPETAGELADWLVDFAEKTPPAERTTDEFIDAMQLVDQLLAQVPTAAAKEYRNRLNAVIVRVVRIKTVEEEMRYDTPYFAVEAGRDVQVIIQNEDLMPHNFVITVPGALKEVALEGSAMSPMDAKDGKQYVPVSDKVLQATSMIQSHQQERLTFKAPTEPGEYPFVCTFPRHWMRMYGVMVVVKDLDEYLKNPVAPTDPIGNMRQFVQNWKFEDLQPKIEVGIKARSLSIGEKIFTDATCAQCHKMNEKGGAVGPDLTKVFERWKGSREGVLREILDPSHKIDPKFAVHVIYTIKGKVVSGIIQSEDKESISVIDNPEKPEPRKISRDDIDEITKSTKSLMPKALLDQFTEDEIFELLNYIEKSGKE
jgi:putative heme-binding domain-containing protein